jgi:release factor glutamine methyltransferase
MSRIQVLLDQGALQLREAGIEGARAEARLLLEAASGIARARQIAWPESDVDQDAADRFTDYLGRRRAREPMSHILGRREFWSLPFIVTKDTLDPRPESEILVELVLAHAKGADRPLRILDLGSGTGCLLLALLSELANATGVGVDRSPGALEVARANAARLDLADRGEFRMGDWDAGIDPCWDIVVSNPPYVPTMDIDALEPEVMRFEPRVALDGGADGLEAYRRLMPAAARLLAPRGFAAFEFGAGQAGAIEAIGNESGLICVETRTDLAGRARAALFCRACR